jgi:hypothetical protein
MQTRGIPATIGSGNFCLPLFYPKITQTIKMHRDIILLAVFYGRETLYLTTREEYRLDVSESLVLRKIFRPKG